MHTAQILYEISTTERGRYFQCCLFSYNIGNVYNRSNIARRRRGLRVEEAGNFLTCPVLCFRNQQPDEYCSNQGQPGEGPEGGEGAQPVLDVREAVSKTKVTNPGECHYKRIYPTPNRGREQFSRNRPGNCTKANHKEYDEGHHAHQGHPD